VSRSTRESGLGLHIARQLIEAMSGRIWVDGAPGEGAVFHITAPVVRETVPDKATGDETLALDHRALPSPSPAPSNRNELTVS
jgi:hypothetical protein